MILDIIKSFFIGWIILTILALSVFVYTRIEEKVGKEIIQLVAGLSVAATVLGWFVLCIIK